MTEFTKEQLVELTREDVEFWRERDELIPSWQTALRLRQAEITLAALTDGTEQEAVYQVRHGDQWRDLDKVQYNDHVNLGAEGLRILYAAPQLPQPELTVFYKSMPESNGKENWTAILHRKGEGIQDGITIDRSDYPGRVLYAADRVRYLIGEKPDRPYILDYDGDKHSGYVKPVSQPYKLCDGWVAVPVEPTEDMVIAGFEAELREELRDPEAWAIFEAMSGCEQAAHRAKLCWAAMIAAVPQQETKI